MPKIIEVNYIRGIREHFIVKTSYVPCFQDCPQHCPTTNQHQLSVVFLKRLNPNTKEMTNVLRGIRQVKSNLDDSPDVNGKPNTKKEVVRGLTNTKKTTTIRRAYPTSFFRFSLNSILFLSN